MKLQNTYRLITNGGGGGKAPPMAAPAAAAPAPPPTENQGPDPAMQAEIERQRSLRFKAGQTGDSQSTGTDAATGTTTEDPNAKKTTILGA